MMPRNKGVLGKDSDRWKMTPRTERVVVLTLLHGEAHKANEAVGPRTKMSSLQDKLRNEIESALHTKRKCREAIESLRTQISSIKKQIYLLEEQEDDANEQLSVSEHRLNLISSSEPVEEIEPYPYCKRSGYLSLLGEDLKVLNSVRSLQLALRLGTDESIESMQSLIEQVANYKELQRIELFYGRYQKQDDAIGNIADLLMNAIALNGNVQDIVLRVRPTVPVLCSFIPTYSRFTFHVNNFYYPCPGDSDQIVSHLFTMVASTTQLCELRDESIYGSSTELFFHWDHGNGGACKFRCTFEKEMVTTLSKKLQSMTQLENLMLQGIDLRDASWDDIFPSLSQGLKCLSLIDCRLGDNATSGYKNLIQTNPSIYRALLEHHYHDFPDHYVSGTVGGLWNSILKNLPVGSHLQELSLTVSKSLDVFLETLVSVGPTIPLPSIRLYVDRDYDVLAKYIPKMTSLRELHLGIHADRTASICTALLQNEYLYHVEFCGLGDKRQMYSAILKRVKACCERNEYLPALLLDPATTESSSISPSPFNHLLLLLAFSAARQMQVTKLSKILSSLRSCGDCIGPNQKELVTKTD